MQEVVCVDIVKCRVLQGVVIAIHLLALAALYISGLDLVVKLLLTVLLLVIGFVTQRKYIQQRRQYQLLSYFDDLPTAKNSPEAANMLGWRMRSSADEWINLELQSSSVFLNVFMILTFVIKPAEATSPLGEAGGDIGGAERATIGTTIGSIVGEKLGLDRSGQAAGEQIIQLPLINGDIHAEEFRALKVLLKFSD